jgi:hypothetical protein
MCISESTKSGIDHRRVSEKIVIPAYVFYAVADPEKLMSGGKSIEWGYF